MTSKADSWQTIWDNAGTTPGFHKFELNPFLTKYLSDFVTKEEVQKSDNDLSVLMPLCGKAKDLVFLSGLGLKTVGVEFVQNAIDQLADEESFSWKEPTESGTFAVYERDGSSVSKDDKEAAKTGSLQVWKGDFFKFKADYLKAAPSTKAGGKPFKFAFDRASLVAIDPEMRTQYADTMTALCETILLVTFSYDQANMSGPPYSLTKEDIDQLFGEHYTITLLETKDLSGISFVNSLSTIHELVFKLVSK